MNTHTVEGPDLGDFYMQVDDTYHALRAFNFLIDHLYENAPDGISATIGYGIGQLLRRQVDDMEEIRASAGHLTERLKRAEAAVSAPEIGVKEGFANSDDPGIQAGSPVNTETEASIRDMTRKVHHADRLRGADLGRIARDTNLKEDVVRRVVNRLLADPDVASAPIGKAV